MSASMASVPTRLDINDPGYDWDLGRSLVITLNGAVQTKVLAYDAIKGEVTRYCTDEHGSIVIDRDADCAKVETVRGDVIVTRK